MISCRTSDRALCLVLQLPAGLLTLSQFHPFSVFLLMINVKVGVTLLDVYTLQK